MSVYVDNARMPYRRMLMCHLLADTPAELHAMADTIGVQRRWYQAGASTPHYDVCLTKRELAIAAGAIPVERGELGALIKRLRVQRLKEIAAAEVAAARAARVES